MISNDATTCPYCGKPLTNRGVVMVAVFAGLLFFVWIVNYVMAIH